MAIPLLAGTEAFKGEMITDTLGIAAPEHHDVSATYFQYIMSDRGMAVPDRTPHMLDARDLRYAYEYEPHAFVK